MSEQRLHIGFIGLGVMGEPMCRNLVASGRHDVVVHDLRPDSTLEGLSSR